MRAPHIGCAAGAAVLAALAAALLGASCAETPRGLLTDIPSPPPEIQQACSLATTRCSHCHPIERVVVSRGIGTGKWQMYVEQMRLKPTSGISPDDAEIIFRCLRFVEEACVECKRGPS
ncbi:MAG TPA: hypothetical protein VFT22_03260 [Kofleriaceae bacterium]|nr:hypothetical protein [Kofleriaceae bacterium]